MSCMMCSEKSLPSLSSSFLIFWWCSARMRSWTSWVILISSAGSREQKLWTLAQCLALRHLNLWVMSICPLKHYSSQGLYNVVWAKDAMNLQWLWLLQLRTNCQMILSFGVGVGLRICQLPEGKTGLHQISGQILPLNCSVWHELITHKTLPRRPGFSDYSKVLQDASHSKAWLWCDSDHVQPYS